MLRGDRDAGVDVDPAVPLHPLILLEMLHCLLGGARQRALLEATLPQLLPMVEWLPGRHVVLALLLKTPREWQLRTVAEAGLLPLLCESAAAVQLLGGGPRTGRGGGPTMAAAEATLVSAAAESALELLLAVAEDAPALQADLAAAGGVAAAAALLRSDAAGGGRSGFLYRAQSARVIIASLVGTGPSGARSLDRRRAMEDRRDWVCAEPGLLADLVRMLTREGDDDTRRGDFSLLLQRVTLGWSVTRTRQRCRRAVLAGATAPLIELLRSSDAHARTSAESVLGQLIIGRTYGPDGLLTSDSVRPYCSKGAIPELLAAGVAPRLLALFSDRRESVRAQSLVLTAFLAQGGDAACAAILDAPGAAAAFAAVLASRGSSSHARGCASDSYNVVHRSIMPCFAAAHCRLSEAQNEVVDAIFAL
jgi:hypothetical protein